MGKMIRLISLLMKFSQSALSCKFATFHMNTVAFGHEKTDFLELKHYNIEILQFATLWPIFPHSTIQC